MLIEQPRAVERRGIPKWIWISGVIFLCAVLAGMVLLLTRWPFTRDMVTQSLEEASGREVQIRTISNTYIPPGCVAEGVQFLRHKHPEAAPIITMEKLVIRGSFTGLFSSPKRLSEVRVMGMHMFVPVKAEDTNSTSVLLNSGPGGKGIAISEIAVDNAVLEFVSEGRSKKPYVLKVDRLRVRNVGAGAPLSYSATLTNTEPPGVIRAEGKFGPWNPTDIGGTAVAGTYTYDEIDLGVFGSISGKGRARGQFSGPLSRIETHGRIDVAGFHMDGSDHAVQLAVTYEAVVNGTTGDVLLQPASARFRQTQVDVRGWISGHQNGEGKTASFDLAVPAGRLDDLLYLLTKGEPGMSGEVAVNGKFVWPPGPRKFLEKIRMDLAVGIKDGRFTSSATQGSIDAISKSAQGETKKEEESDPRTILSKLHGNIQLRNGTAALSAMNFEVTGADAVVHGTYNLLNQRVDLDGTLDTRGQLSDATAGFKSVVLKAVLSLSKKESSVRVIPFHITGSYGNTSLGIDWKKDLLHTAK
jgi:hypothetical protein